MWHKHTVYATRWVQSVMANGFKSPAGVLAITGLMGLPLWLWACRYFPALLLYIMVFARTGIQAALFTAARFTVTSA